MPSALRLACATLVLTAVGLVAPVTGVRQQPSADRALPDFDIRDGRPPQSPSPQAEAELGRSSQGGPRRVRVHPFTTGVRLLEHPGVSVRPNAPAAGLRNVVASLADRLGLEDGDFASLVVQRDYVSQSNGVRTVTFGQVVDGVPGHDPRRTLGRHPPGDVERRANVGPARRADRRGAGGQRCRDEHPS